MLVVEVFQLRYPAWKNKFILKENYIEVSCFNSKLIKLKAFETLSSRRGE
jgi:hypothetical protein